MPLKAGFRVQGSGFSKENNLQSLTTNPRILGLLAGQGELPCAIASEAKKQGYRVLGIALDPPGDNAMKAYVDEFHMVHIGHFGRIIKLLKKNSVTGVVMAGKVSKGLLYKNKKDIRPDLRAIKFLFSLRNRSDESFLNAVASEIEKDGIKVLKATSFTGGLLTPEGVLTKKHPKKSQLNDIEFGWRIAKEVGRLDIGQTVIVKGTAVMAVEAIEGTDDAILRGGNLAQEGAVVVKVSRPQQDMRLDVPVVGINTLDIMKKAKASVLAIEAGKSIIINREKFIKEADKAGIAVVGISGDK